MRRFFVEEIIKRDGYCVISGNEARHISRVLRMDKGDKFILMDSGGNRFEAVIESANCQEILVTLKRPLPLPPASSPEITLCQAILKSRPMDYVIEKTSELGVKNLIPFSSERTVIRLDRERASAKVRRWREIAKSAAKQADRIKPAEISSPVSFQAVTDRWPQNDVMKVILWEEEESKDLKKLLRTTAPMKQFLGMIGPEGGFSKNEIEIAKEAGFESVSVGKRILRSETAAIILVAIVQYEWGDLSLSGSKT